MVIFLKPLVKSISKACEHGLWFLAETQDPRMFHETCLWTPLCAQLTWEGFVGRESIKKKKKRTVEFWFGEIPAEETRSIFAKWAVWYLYSLSGGLGVFSLWEGGRRLCRYFGSSSLPLSKNLLVVVWGQAVWPIELRNPCPEASRVYIPTPSLM